MKDFVRLLIAAAEKAANIARIIRNEKELFSLLIQEKDNEEKNKRFVQDFKTLADVLIQESLRRDISAKYPEMKDNIYGEENNTFSNALGETITVKIEDTAQKTGELLSIVIDGNLQAAMLLADEIHKAIELDEDEASEVLDDLIESYKDIGIWIDPIDGTNEYIKGSAEFQAKENNENIWPSGLQCVTVLIGAFNLKSGRPVAGVINQPFYEMDESTKLWRGRRFWGICTEGQTISSVDKVRLPGKKVAILSSSEDPDLQSKLEDKFDLVSSAGAGYKLLTVILGLSDVYVLSKDSTHFWDTCAPHAILNSLRGGIINYQVLRNFSSETTKASSTLRDIVYDLSNQEAKDRHYANIGGIVAYMRRENIDLVLDAIVK